MGVSRARKHGKYLGGRPWPKVCPTCRNCGNGAPTHFYNSRGLCNVCHKDIREAGGKEALELWEQLPPEADDRSLERLYKNPTRWLQKYMTGTYAQPFIAQGPACVLGEATRVFGSIVDRWYGRESTPSILYAPPSPVHEIVWSTSTSSAEADEPPIVTAQGKTVDQVREGDALRRERRNDLRKFYQWIGNKLISFAQDTAPRLQPPGTFVTGSEYAVIWIDKEVPVSVVVSGEVERDGGLISLVEDRTHNDFFFDYEQLGHMLRCLGA